MMNKALFFLLMILTACQSTTPAGRDPAQTDQGFSGHIFRMNMKDEPQTLDPRKARDLNAINLMKMLFEGLTRINQHGEVELALAERVDISEDLTVFTFYLKEAFWTNGDPVTAEDFAYAWKTCLSPEFPSDVAFQMYPIKNGKLAKEGQVSLEEIGISVMDSKTLKVELETPIPYFLNLLSSPPFFPVRHEIDQLHPHWADQIDDFVSNGPFALQEWKHQDHFKVVKNNLYWDAGQVRLSGLELVMVQEETELMMFEKKELDWAGSPLSNLPVEAIQSLKRKHLLQTKEMLGTYFLRTNTEKPPFNHSKIRSAFALAIDRKAIVDHVTQGNQIPATGIVPSAFRLTDSTYFQDGDSKKARALFDEALLEMGLSKESLPEISLLYRSSERNHLIAQAIQQQWFKAFGIRVKLEAFENKVYFDRISKQDYHLACSSWTADFDDPINFLEVFKYKHGSSNNTLWENEEYVRLLNESSKTLDLSKRFAFLAASEKILVEEMPVIPIFYYTMLYVNSPEVKDIVLSSSGQLDFKWAYFDKKCISN